MKQTFVEKLDQLREEILKGIQAVIGEKDCFLKLKSPAGSDFSSQITMMGVVQTQGKLFLRLHSLYTANPYYDYEIEDSMTTDLAFLLDELERKQFTIEEPLSLIPA